MLRGLDICAGSGIGSLAFERAGLSRTVCYIERDPHCCRIIQQRQRDGWLSPAPIWDDLRTFDGRPWRGCVDFIFGGIPCTPYSVAGKQQGAADERDLWPDLRRVIGEVGPRFALLENVPGLLAFRRAKRKRAGVGTEEQFPWWGEWAERNTGTLDEFLRLRARYERGKEVTWWQPAEPAAIGRILGEFSDLGYRAELATVSAADVGAWHLRKRVWIVAYAAGRRCEPGGWSRQTESLHVPDEGGAHVPHAEVVPLRPGLRAGGP